MNLLNNCTDVSEIVKEVGAHSRVGFAVGVGVGVGAVAVTVSRLANLRNSTIQVWIFYYLLELSIFQTKSFAFFFYQIFWVPILTLA